jgi:hypothetical protein
MYGTEVHYIMWNKPTLENKYCMIHSYMAYKKKLISLKVRVEWWLPEVREGQWRGGGMRNAVL